MSRGAACPFQLAGNPWLGYYRCVAKGGNSMLQYKVVELSNVTDETIEETLNEWTAQGWRFDGLQFAMRESSKRPSMAFVLFTRDGKHDT